MTLSTPDNEFTIVIQFVPNSEQSDECIDSTMMWIFYVLLHNNLPIKSFDFQKCGWFGYQFGFVLEFIVKFKFNTPKIVTHSRPNAQQSGTHLPN